MHLPNLETETVVIHSLCHLYGISIQKQLHIDFLLVVSIAKNAALCVQKIANGDRGCNGAEVDFEVGGHVGAGGVVADGLAADFVQADGRVLLLPLPVDVVDLGVVEVEERFCVGEGVLNTASSETLLLRGRRDLPPGLLAALPA